MVIVIVSSKWGLVSCIEFHALRAGITCPDSVSLYLEQRESNFYQLLRRDVERNCKKHLEKTVFCKHETNSSRLSLCCVYDQWNGHWTTLLSYSMLKLIFALPGRQGGCKLSGGRGMLLLVNSAFSLHTIQLEVGCHSMASVPMTWWRPSHLSQVMHSKDYNL